MHDANSTLSSFLEAVAARQPTPGGGSVAALAGALSAATGSMVINYSLGKKGTEAHAAELHQALAEFTRARQLLLEQMVIDQVAYETITAVRKLPADAPGRQEQYVSALMQGINAPQAIAATSVAMLDLADRMVNYANYYLLSDLAVCADLAMATTRCALYSVRINCRDLPDPQEQRKVEATSGQLLSKAAVLIQRISPRIWARDAAGPG